MSELKNMKIRIKDEEHSRKVQEHLFSLGYRWCVHGQRVVYTDKLYLFTNSDDSLITYGDDKHWFENHDNTEYVLEELATYALKEVVPIAPKMEESLEDKINKAVQEAFANALRPGGMLYNAMKGQ